MSLEQGILYIFWHGIMPLNIVKRRPFMMLFLKIQINANLFSAKYIRVLFCVFTRLYNNLERNRLPGHYLILFLTLGIIRQIAVK